MGKDMAKNIAWLGMWLAVVWLASSATIYVATDGDDTRTGLTDWTNAVATISNGVAKATSSGNLVLVSNGVYTLTAQIAITANITVQSWNNGAVDQTNTIVNGNNGVRCFKIANTGAAINGFTVFNGRAAAGAGIEIGNGTVRNCIIVSNVSDGVGGNDGGGLYLTDRLMLTDCEIRDNYAKYGGAA